MAIVSTENVMDSIFDWMLARMPAQSENRIERLRLMAEENLEAFTSQEIEQYLAKNQYFPKI